MAPRTPVQLLLCDNIAKHKAGVVHEMLRDPGLDVNAPCDPAAFDKVSPLMAALLAGDPQVLEPILRHPRLDLGRSLPKHEAWTWARSCSLDLLKTFLTHPGTDVNRSDGNGTTLLHEVVVDRQGHGKLVFLLHRDGILVDPQQYDGTSPLYRAALSGNLDAVETLLQYAVDANNRNRDNLWTVLMIAVAENHPDVVDRLAREPRVDINAKSDSGDTALLIAAERGHARCVEHLLEHPGVDVNEKNAEGWTALMKAAFKDRLDVMRLLLGRQDLDVNLVDCERQTALHWAVLDKNVASVRLLLDDPRTNPAITNRPLKQTAYDLARSLGLEPVARMLEARIEAGTFVDELSPGDVYVARVNEQFPSPVEPFVADPTPHEGTRHDFSNRGRA